MIPDTHKEILNNNTVFHDGTLLKASRELSSNQLKLWIRIYQETVNMYKLSFDCSVADLAKICYCSERTMQRTIRALKKKGWITVTSKPGSCNNYALNDQIMDRELLIEGIREEVELTLAREVG